MEENYSLFTPEERLDRIAEILVRWIYRAEVRRRAEAAGVPRLEHERTYNLTEAAQKIGVSKRTLQRWIDKRKFMPACRKGRIYLISAGELRNLRGLKMVYN